MKKVSHCVLNKNELSFHYKKYERNGLTMFSPEKLSVYIEKSEKNGLTMFSQKKFRVLTLEK